LHSGTVSLLFLGVNGGTRCDRLHRRDCGTLLEIDAISKSEVYIFNVS